METYVYRWDVERGEREQLLLPVRDDSGNIVDVTGFSADMVIREFKSHLAPIRYTFPANLLTTSAEGVTVTIPVPVSDAWDWSDGWYEVYVTNPSGTEGDPLVSRVAEGWITLS